MTKFKLAIVAMSGAALLGGCATMSETERDGARGAGLGAVGGAVVGAIAGDPLAGAAIGAVAGGAIGVATSDGNNRCERDRDGRRICYDRDGRAYYPRRR
jgi:Glycine-zipper domain